MANKGTKKRLIVNGTSYISSTKTHVNREYEKPLSVVLTLYLEGNRTTFFRLHFLERENSDLMAGYFAGEVTELSSDFYVNLNRPGAISAIISKAKAEGWAPSLGGKPTEIRDGLEWIKQIDFPEDVGSVSH